jgi:hypothetical protein
VKRRESKINSWMIFRLSYRNRFRLKGIFTYFLLLYLSYKSQQSDKWHPRWKNLDIILGKSLKIMMILTTSIYFKMVLFLILQNKEAGEIWWEILSQKIKNHFCWIGISSQWRICLIISKQRQYVLLVSLIFKIFWAP